MTEQMDINRFRDLLTHVGIKYTEIKVNTELFISVETGISGPKVKGNGLCRMSFSLETGEFTSMGIWE